MKIKTFSVNIISVNCYIVSDETKECVIIDCGVMNDSEWAQITKYIDAEELTVKHLLCTHLHFDHIWGNARIKSKYGMGPIAHADDEPLYYKAGEMFAQLTSVRVPDFDYLPAIERRIEDGDIITFGNTEIKVIHTLGHSRGCVCYYIEKEKVLFSGDTLFAAGMGRTDLEGGSYPTLITSIREKLFTLPDDVKVFPGHGPSTTIGREK